MIQFDKLKRHSTPSHSTGLKFQFEHEMNQNRWDHRTTTFTFVCVSVSSSSSSTRCQINEMKDPSRTINFVCDENWIKLNYTDQIFNIHNMQFPASGFQMVIFIDTMYNQCFVVHICVIWPLWNDWLCDLAAVFSEWQEWCLVAN